MEDNIGNLYNTLQAKVDQIKDDFDKFDNGNNLAGLRIRKAMQEIKVLSQNIRIAVQTIKNRKK